MKKCNLTAAACRGHSFLHNVSNEQLVLVSQSQRLKLNEWIWGNLWPLLITKHCKANERVSLSVPASWSSSFSSSIFSIFLAGWFGAIDFWLFITFFTVPCSSVLSFFPSGALLPVSGVHFVFNLFFIIRGSMFINFWTLSVIPSFPLFSFRFFLPFILLHRWLINLKTGARTLLLLQCAVVSAVSAN